MNFISTAQAAMVTINPNLPGISGAGAGLQGFINNFYSFALIIAGILAFGAIVWGGIRYATGRGNPSAESEGKSYIYNALLGLLLLAGAWIILYTVNPNIVGLTLPGLPTLNPPTTTGAGGGGVGYTCGGSTNGTCPTGQTCDSTGIGYVCHGVATGGGGGGGTGGTTYTCAGNVNGTCPTGLQCNATGFGYACT